MTLIPDDVNVDYSDGRNESPADYPVLVDKMEKAAAVTHRALEAYDNPAIMWTGGKDSTLTLYFVRSVAEKHGYDVPPAVFLDHFQHFPDVIEFVERWAAEWDIDLHMARNDDVASNAGDPGEEVFVDHLNEQNQRHVREILQYDNETFPFLLNTYVGNHLLKTVPLNDSIERLDIDGIISGVRWDEQEARADETFFSPRHDPETYPPHDRVHPILQFTETDVWDAMWTEVVPDVVDAYPDAGYVPKGRDDLPSTVDIEDVPVPGRYFDGYRSLGSAISTEKTDDQPAWVQDLAHTTERAGRAQDKENLMDRLRDLGYM